MLKYLRKKRVWIPLTLPPLLFAALFGDSIIAHKYLDHLCETQAGTFTLNQIELGPEYWNEDGSPNFLSKYGGFNNDYFRDRFKYERKSSSDIGFSVRRLIMHYYDTETKKSLVEVVFFTYSGGWFVNNMQPFYVQTKMCEREDIGYNDTKNSKADVYGADVIKKMFIKD